MVILHVSRRSVKMSGMRMQEFNDAVGACVRSGTACLTLGDLAALTREGGATLRATIRRMCDVGRIVAAGNGVYVPVETMRGDGAADLLHHVAAAMRRGDLTYVSFESALSEYGVISQIPIGRLTLMTTGRRGVFPTPWGEIEMVTTRRPADDIMEGLVSNGRPLPYATPDRAMADMRRAGRSLDLADLAALREVAREINEVRGHGHELEAAF